jgi:hypothetical protein
MTAATFNRRRPADPLAPGFNTQLHGIPYRTTLILQLRVLTRSWVIGPEPHHVDP